MSIVDAEKTAGLFDGIEADMTKDAVEYRRLAREHRALALRKYGQRNRSASVFDHLPHSSPRAIRDMNQPELLRVQIRVSRTMAVASHAIGVALYEGEFDTLAVIAAHAEPVGVTLTTPFMDIDKPAVVGKILDPVITGHEGMVMIDKTKGLQSPKHTSILDIGMAVLLAETKNTS